MDNQNMLERLIKKCLFNVDIGDKTYIDEMASTL